MYFTALSLKIANEQSHSLCGIELVKVHNSQIVAHKSWLFQPHSMSISPLCHKHYKLKLSDLMDAPSLPSVWPEISSHLQNQFILCHKAVWMIPILLKTLDAHKLSYPNCQLGCTLIMSKRLYPHLIGHNLSSLQNHLKFTPSFNQEITPALQTAFLALHMAQTLNLSTLSSLLETLHLHASTIKPHASITSCLPTFNGPLNSITTSHACSIPTANKSGFSFAGKVVSLTGPLESMPRVDAVKKLHALDAVYSSTVTSKTNVVLTNIKNPELLPLDTLTSKLRRALILKAQGQMIDIISEEIFLQAVKALK